MFKIIKSRFRLLLSEDFMKTYLLVFVIFYSTMLFAQKSDLNTLQPNGNSVLESSKQVKKSNLPVIASISIGFLDYYRNENYYNMPGGYQKVNTSGFSPLSAKLEYGFNKHLHLYLSFYLDNFSYNFNKLDTGNGIVFKRNAVDNFRLLAGGFGFRYYFDNYIHINNIESFITCGFSLNNIHYSALPQGDSISAKTTHEGHICLKVGARYAITKSKNAGIFAEIGYDKQSVIDIGFSCNLQKRKR